jgi:hypothetical protein
MHGVTVLVQDEPDTRSDPSHAAEHGLKRRERPTGLEPVIRAWKALVLPLHHGRARRRVVVRAADRERTLERIRSLCLALPETSERASHGAPTFFVRGKRAFLMVLTNHHGDGRFAIWCAAPDGLQKLLVDADPERFFVPPYVGHRGWLGVRLDRGLDWDELAGLAEDAYAQVAPTKLVDAARSRS